MNKHQWRILAVGAATTVSILIFGTSRLHPFTAGPSVEHAPGYYSQTFTDAAIPTWAVFVSLGLAGLTAAAIYRSRTSDTA